MGDNAIFKKIMTPGGKGQVPKWLQPLGANVPVWYPEAFIRLKNGAHWVGTLYESENRPAGYIPYAHHPDFAEINLGPDHYFTAKNFTVHAPILRYVADNMPPENHIYLGMPGHRYPETIIYSSILIKHEPLKRPEKRARTSERRYTPSTSNSPPF